MCFGTAEEILSTADDLAIGLGECRPCFVVATAQIKNFSRFLRLCLNTVKTINFTDSFRNASMRNKCKRIVHSKEYLSQVLYGISGGAN